MLPVSRDTLLRVIRRRATTRSYPLGVIDIDDLAWRRNHRYGTLVCDLERRRIMALLPDREQATAQTWLKKNASIQIVARDRGGGYGEAIARALPQAIQVADRWHFMENASRGFLDAVRRSMRQVREVVGAATLDPALLAAAERIQHEGHLRREEADAAIRALAEAGVPIRRIGQRLGHSRKACMGRTTGLGCWSVSPSCLDIIKLFNYESVTQCFEETGRCRSTLSTCPCAALGMIIPSCCLSSKRLKANL